MSRNSRLLEKLNAHCLVHSNLLRIPVLLNYKTPVHAFLPYLFKRNFNTIFLFTCIFSLWSLSFRFSDQSYPFCISSLFNPLNPELNPICYFLALLGAHHFLHVSRIRVKLLAFRLLMSYIYGAPILDVSRSHTTTQHSR